MDMNWKKIVMAFLLAAGLPAAQNALAQTTYEEMEQLTVNEQVTTVITASEPVRFVDISTDKVAGDQPIDNVIRLKPKEAGHEDGEVLAIVTIVTERYRSQYALIYTTRMKEAVTDKEIQLQERNAFNNPAVTMSTADMTSYARRIWNSPAKIRNVVFVGKCRIHAVLVEQPYTEREASAASLCARTGSDAHTGQYQDNRLFHGHSSSNRSAWNESAASTSS